MVGKLPSDGYKRRNEVYSKGEGQNSQMRHYIYIIDQQENEKAKKSIFEAKRCCENNHRECDVDDVILDCCNKGRVHI